MILKKSHIQKLMLVGSDLLALVISLMVVRFMLYHIRPGIDHIHFKTLGIAKLSGLLLLLVFWYQEQYVKRRPIWEEYRLVFRTVFIFALFHVVFGYLLSHHMIRLATILFWLILLCILPILRYIVKLILDRFGLWSRDIYIVGTGDTAKNAYILLMANKILGYNFLGFIELEAQSSKSTLEIGELSLPIIKISDLDQGYIKGCDTEIIFALSSAELHLYAHTINILQTRYTLVSIVPDIMGLPLYGVELEHFFGSDQLFLRLQNNLSRRLNRIIKRILDICISIIALLVLSPLLLIIGLLIKVSTGSRIIFKHQRIGAGGKMFFCMKFQTMYPNSQEILSNLLANDESARAEWNQDFKLKNDPRVTKIGRFLRKTSLDELPQLFNVIKGDMSLVGPRPIISDEILRYGDDAYYYKLVRPGITGLWQISGRNDIDYVTRVRLDVCYTKNWSLWYDFVILFKTIFVVFARSGAY